MSEEQDFIRVKFLFMYKHLFVMQIDLNASFTIFTRLLNYYVTSNYVDFVMSGPFEIFVRFYFWEWGREFRVLF